MNETISKHSTVMGTKARLVCDEMINEDNANNRQRRRALMLHLVGPDVQYYFPYPAEHRRCEGLPESGRCIECLRRSQSRYYVC